MTERLDEKMEHTGWGSHGTIDHEDYPHLKGSINLDPIKTTKDFVSFGENGRLTISSNLIDKIEDVEDKKVCLFLNWERENRSRTRQLNGEEVESKFLFNVRKELQLVFWTDEQLKTAQEKLDKKFLSRTLKPLKNSESMYISIKQYLVQYGLDNLMKKKIRIQNNGVKVEDDGITITVDLLSRGKNKIENG